MFYAVKIQNFCDMAKPQLKKVGAFVQKKEGVPILTHPRYIICGRNKLRPYNAMIHNDNHVNMIGVPSGGVVTSYITSIVTASIYSYISSKKY